MKAAIAAATALTIGLWQSDARSADFTAETAGWTIVGSDTSCAASMDYEGPGSTALMFYKHVDGSILLSVTNYNWSARDGETYDLAYMVDANAYTGGKSTGHSSGGRKGFFTLFNREFEGDFTKGSSLRIYMGNQLVDRLSLSGSAAALEQVNRCLIKVRDTMAAAEQERQRWADLPADPFAGIPRPPAPKGSPGSWVTANDYPIAAMREKRSGVVSFTAQIGRDGAIQSCKVVETSGHADLDATACQLVLRRARFMPATGADGKPTTGEYSNKIRWVLP